jgi:hypothetical protein
MLWTPTSISSIAGRRAWWCLKGPTVAKSWASRLRSALRRLNVILVLKLAKEIRIAELVCFPSRVHSVSRNSGVSVVLGPI